MINKKIIRLKVSDSNLWKKEGEREVEDDTVTIERIIEEKNFLPIAYLEMAIRKARPVALIELGNGAGTGFLVSKDLLLTNNHVFPNKQAAMEATIKFNYEDDILGQPKNTDDYICSPDDFFYTNKELDYSLVKINTRIVNKDSRVQSNPGDIWGYIPLISVKELEVDSYVNIIQHPESRRKEVAFRDNKIVKIDGNLNTVRYTTDTEPGASGSPVYNDKWELVALHHAGGDRDSSGKWLNNEGILISAIINDLLKQLSNSQKEKEILFNLGIQGIEEIKIKFSGGGSVSPTGGGGAFDFNVSL